MILCSITSLQVKLPTLISDPRWNMKLLDLNIFSCVHYLACVCVCVCAYVRFTALALFCHYSGSTLCANIPLKRVNETMWTSWPREKHTFAGECFMVVYCVCWVYSGVCSRLDVNSVCVFVQRVIVGVKSGAGFGSQLLFVAKPRLSFRK